MTKTLGQHLQLTLDTSHHHWDHAECSAIVRRTAG